MGAKSDQLSGFFGLNFETGERSVVVSVSDKALIRNVVGNAHFSLVASLAEYCSSHFLTELIKLDAESRTLSPRRVEHCYHGATARAIRGEIRMSEGQMESLRRKAAGRDRFQVAFDVKIFDGTERSIATSSIMWLVGQART